MLLLSEEFQVFPKDEKTNISFSFSVPEDTASLKITFSYDPKVLEDDERANILIENNIKKDLNFCLDFFYKLLYKPIAFPNIVQLSNIIGLIVSFSGCSLI